MGKKLRIRQKEKRQLQLTPPGSPPGVVVADPNAEHSRLELFAYNGVALIEKPIDRVEDLREVLATYPVIWLNVDGLRDIDTISRVGEIFGFHRLALEDVVHVHQRPKMELYGDHHFIVARMISYRERLETEQFSIFLGKNFVVTFQETGGDCLDPVRNRIRNDRGKIRACGPDYLVYALLDAVIDGYFPVLEKFGDIMDALEDEIITGHHPETISRIHDIKRDLLSVRRAIWPVREVINSLIRDPNPLLSDETRFYLRDCYDHVVRLIDLVENYRELAADLMDLYLSISSNRMNEVMKMLTIIATIFIPLTFIVGVYGMNFDPDSSPWNMPEVRWRYGYPAVWALMITVVIALLAYFRRRGWLGALPAAPSSTGHTPTGHTSASGESRVIDAASSKPPKVP